MDIKSLNGLSPSALSLQFDSTVIRPIRYSLEPSLTTSAASLNENSFQVSNMTITSKTPKLPLIKLHFMALKSGSTNVIIQEDTKTPVLKTVLIQEGRTQ